MLVVGAEKMTDLGNGEISSALMEAGDEEWETSYGATFPALTEQLLLRDHPYGAELEWLKAQGDLIETDKTVDPDLQVTGLQKHLDGGCPVLFNNVKGKPNHRVLTNLFSDMNVINKMFGWTDDVDRTRKLAHALSHPLKPVEISQSEAPLG